MPIGEIDNVMAPAFEHRCLTTDETIEIVRNGITVASVPSKAKIDPLPAIFAPGTNCTVMALSGGSGGSGETVDIDTDSDNTGTVERSAAEDNVEMTSPGNVIRLNWDDDDGNGTQDRYDSGPLASPDGELETAALSWSSGGGSANGFKLTLTVNNTNVKLWSSQTKTSAISSGSTWIIGTDTHPTTIWIEGVEYGQSTITWKMEDTMGQLVHQDSILVSIATGEITAYRPQTEGPGYGNPFPRTAVPAAEEASPGVGIRRNGDNDDNDGNNDNSASDTAISGENDLIEIVSHMQSITGLQYTLSRSNNYVTIWDEQNKSDGILELNDGNSITVSCTAPGATSCNQWVEWASLNAAHTSSTITLEARTTANNQLVFSDAIVFHPFKSVVIVFGGWQSDPLNPASGPFQMASRLYESDGFDVHAFNEEDVDDFNPAPYNEVKSAIEDRLVTQIAIFGNSRGGGATWHLADQLDDNPPTGTWSLRFTAYIDAVDADGVGSEERVPPRTQYHVNYYQHLESWPRGKATTQELNRAPGATIVNTDITNTTWGATFGHSEMDNYSN